MIPHVIILFLFYQAFIHGMQETKTPFSLYCIVTLFDREIEAIEEDEYRVCGKFIPSNKNTFITTRTLLYQNDYLEKRLICLPKNYHVIRVTSTNQYIIGHSHIQGPDSSIFETAVWDIEQLNKDKDFSLKF